MQLEPVNVGILSVWRLRLALIVVPLTLVAVVVSLLLGQSGLSGWRVWIAPIAAVVFVLGAGYCWWWLERFYRSLRFGIDAIGIRIERGVWWRSVVALPLARIQHSDVTQGPLERRYGVATLTFFTAGSVYTKISLPGLVHSDAIALRDSLVGMKENSGV
jgi:membrane protein YdbS with pleckstrin-like domain